MHFDRLFAGDALSALRRAESMPLESGLRAQLERFFGSSLSGIGLYRCGGLAEAGLAGLAAGNRVFVDQEYFAPESVAGRALLAHELAHVLQQRRQDCSAADPCALEREAETVERLWLAFENGARVAGVDLAGLPEDIVGDPVAQARPPLKTSSWFKPIGGAPKSRPDWAGDVTITFEEIMHVKSGTINRPIEVQGIVAPGRTTKRPSAPEPVCPCRVSEAKAVPSLYAYDEETGKNAYNTGITDIEKGHIMALELGGPDIPENIVPQWAKWQGSGVWRTMEKEVAREASKLLKGSPKYYLVFHAVIFYPFVTEAWALLRRVCTPTGFKVTVTKVTEDGTPAGEPTTVFEDRQERDHTDEMLAMRTMSSIGGADFSFPDWATKTRKRKGVVTEKGAFVKKGPDVEYYPPITYASRMGGPKPGTHRYKSTIGTKLSTNYMAQSALNAHKHRERLRALWTPPGKRTMHQRLLAGEFDKRGSGGDDMEDVTTTSTTGTGDPMVD